MAKTSEGMKRNTSKPNPKFEQFDRDTNSQEEMFKVGKTIVISTGPLKGYRGIIKSINKDRI